MIHTDETRRKLSEIRSGNKNPFYGKHHTQEFKDAQSKRSKELNSKRQYDIVKQHVKIPNDIRHLAYIAGFLDADGSIRFVHSKQYTRPFVAFYNTNIDVLNYIYNIFEYGNIIKTGGHGREQVRCIRYDSANDVYAIAKALLPLLIVKKEDATLAIKFLEDKYGNRLMSS